jgi:Mg2+-importing ATPase
VLDELFRQGRRVLAVATRPMPGATSCSAADERGLRLEGLLVFADPVRADAAAALERLRRLEVDVKIITGDNGVVAQTVCAQVGMRAGDTIDGAALDALDDAALSAQLPATTVFARVSPEQKARIVRVARLHGADVGFLGDGANDAVALHEADVGISVDGAAEVAKDAADVVLLRHALDVLADGVVGGRRIFANTVKYVLMGTSSNFGNMISAAGASLVLPFLPLLPTQVLLNNLLYDAGQLPIPSDRVDEEMLRRPAGWDVGLIRRYMAVFGPISSLFDVLMFVVLLRAFHAGPELFRSGWFVESLATQTLVVHVIRTRRTPFFRSRPGTALLVTTLAVVAAAFAIPWLPFAGDLGFVPLPASLVATIVGFIVAYLALVEAAKVWFFAHEERLAARAPRISALPAAVAVTGRQRRVHRRAARFSHRGKLNNG